MSHTEALTGAIGLRETAQDVARAQLDAAIDWWQSGERAAKTEAEAG